MRIRWPAMAWSRWISPASWRVSELGSPLSLTTWLATSGSTGSSRVPWAMLATSLSRTAVGRAAAVAVLVGLLMGWFRAPMDAEAHRIDTSESGVEQIWLRSVPEPGGLERQAAKSRQGTGGLLRAGRERVPIPLGTLPSRS